MIIFDDEKFYKKFIGCEIPKEYSLDEMKAIRQCFNRLYANGIIKDSDEKMIDVAIGMYERIKESDIKMVFAKQNILSRERVDLIKMSNRKVVFTVKEIYFICKLEKEIERAISVAIMFLCKYFNRKYTYTSFSEIKLIVEKKKNNTRINEIKLAKGCFHKNKYRFLFGYMDICTPNFFERQRIEKLKSKISDIEYKYNGECYLSRSMKDGVKFIQDLHIAIEYIRDENKEIFKDFYSKK